MDLDYLASYDKLMPADAVERSVCLSDALGRPCMVCCQYELNKETGVKTGKLSLLTLEEREDGHAQSAAGAASHLAEQESGATAGEAKADGSADGSADGGTYPLRFQEQACLELPAVFDCKW